jgi:hypothetical protein
MNHHSNFFQAAHQKRWTACQNRRRNAWRWEVINVHRDTVAVVYSGKDDAELLASAPQQHAAAQELRACTKRLAAILGQFQERLVPSELEALNRARELTAW